tara:strand:+ start:1822 stop:1971 length:150 start_codon:yes stop_codon:yes gene_type:complete
MTEVFVVCANCGAVSDIIGKPKTECIITLNGARVVFPRGHSWFEQGDSK